MRATLSRQMEAGRIWNREIRETPGAGPVGDFIVTPFGQRMLIVASNGSDWIEAGLELPAWEHVSVSLAHRCPTWTEMEWVREQFFEPHETVVQFSVPRDEHIAGHTRRARYCLHLWRPIGIVIPRPPSSTVGVKP